VAINETKIITKSADDNGFYTKRERAQKINFAQLQEILQRNVTVNSNKSYTQYTKELIKTYLLNPTSNINTIREVSRFLVRNSMIYKKMIYYYATMPLFLYSVTQYNDLSKNITANKALKGYEEVLRRLNAFNMQKELYSVIATTLRDGIYCGYVYDNEDQGMFIMPLDPQYCKIYGKTAEGEWIVYFDAAYFDKGNNEEFVKGINEDGVGVWDSCFVDGYNAFKEDGREYQWFRLPPEKTLCLIAGTDDEFETPLPYFLPLFVSLLDLIDLEQILMSKTELENYILLVSKIPMLQGTSDVDDFSISLELAQQFNAMLEQVVPELVGVAYSPMEIDTVKFDKSNSTEDTDKLAQSMNNLFNNAGISQLVVAGGASTNSIGLSHAIENDQSNVWTYVSRLESWFNFYIKMNVSEGYKFKYHQISWYNRDSYISNMQTMATLGGSALDYFVCATSKTPYEVLNDIRFNALALNINQWLVPLASSYTQSGSTTSSTGGAPTKSEDEITSEETIKTRDGDKNGNTTSKVE
jgi:hypothetical protein